MIWPCWGTLWAWHPQADRHVEAYTSPLPHLTSPEEPTLWIPVGSLMKVWHANLNFQCDSVSRVTQQSVSLGFFPLWISPTGVSLLGAQQTEVETWRGAMWKGSQISVQALPCPGGFPRDPAISFLCPIITLCFVFYLLLCLVMWRIYPFYSVRSVRSRTVSVVT